MEVYGPPTGEGGSSDHGLLTGLDDDDHEQYLTEDRGSALFVSLSTDLALQTELNDHLTDASAAHAASAISIADAGNDFTATTVEGALDELQSDAEADAAALAAHLADAADAHAGTAITNTPAGGISATTVQAALNELDSEKANTSAVVQDGDAAGGVLSGTYPNPGFAADMATQAELDTHVANNTDAHDASAISVLDTAGNFVATNVETVLKEMADAGVGFQDADQTPSDAFATISSTNVQDALEEIYAEASGSPDASDVTVNSATLVGTGTDAQAVFEELDNAIADHIADTSAAHAASAVSVSSATLVGVGTDVQAVLEELDDGIADHLADTSAAHAATAISFTPAGTIAATTVQAAIEEVASEAGGGGAAAQPVPILAGFGLVPDSTAEAFFEPLDITLGSNDISKRLALCLGSATAAAPTVKHGVYGSFRVPDGYNAGAKIRIEWTATLTSGDVVFDFDYNAVSGDGSETADPAAWQESVTVTDTVAGTARRRSSLTVNLTSGNLAAGDNVDFFFGRDGADGADTMAGRAFVTGAYFEYTV